MVKPEELRAGNWVICPKGLAQVKVIDSRNCDILTWPPKVSDWCGKTSDLRLIPLTDAVLEACCAGWEGRKYANFFDCTISPLCVWYNKSEEGWFFLSADIGVEGVVVNVSPISLKGKYLHQLQNLYFAITGKELEIDEVKLKKVV